MRTSMVVLFCAAVTATAPAQPVAVEYRFDDVDRKVFLVSGAQKTQVRLGQHARGGDKVETGWFSHTIIATEEHRATFELFSSTEVTLARDTPGVILSLERGHIRAAFDKILGSEPRIVKTPGALLAVRGTEFDVRVDRNGDTEVDVFEGLVEIRSPLRAEPAFVRAGEQSVFGRKRPPSTRPMPEHRKEERDRARQPEGRDGRRQGGVGPDPRDGRRGEGGQTGASRPPAPPKQPPRQPPPQRPPESF